MPRDKRSDSAPQPIDVTALSLWDFIGILGPRVFPEWSPPYFFRQMIDDLERMPYARKRKVMAAPRQHGKSTLLFMAIVYWMLKYPRLRIIYYAYGIAFAQTQGRIVRRLYAFAEGRTGDRDTQNGWTTPEGGSILFTSTDGTLVGLSGDMLVVDDPLKNRAEAEDSSNRAKVDAAIRDDALPCLTPDASAVIAASRYHQDDPSGRMISRGWDYMHYRAVSEDPVGLAPPHPAFPDFAHPVALWPEVRDLDFLAMKLGEVLPYGFASMFQGEPMPAATSLFQGCTTYREDGTRVARYILGVDLAYSHGKRSDYASIVALADCFDHWRIAEVVRAQWGIQRARAELIAMRGKYTFNGIRPRLVSYVAGPEKGVYIQLSEWGVDIEMMPARYNKLVRAERASDAWARGRLRVPGNAPWLDAFISELRYFDGGEDAHDDQVDALVSAFDAGEGAKTQWPGGPHGGFNFGERLAGNPSVYRGRCM